ncbi:MAG: ABC transporter substrate-binding protein [Pseudomonadota bacterium]
MKKSFLTLAVMGLALAFTTAASAAEKAFINGIDANYPPFAYVDNNGKAAGFDVESMDWIANKMGFTIEHKPMDWDGIIPSLLANKIDMVCSGMSVTPERAAQVTFSDAYWKVARVFVAKQDSGLTPEAIVAGGKRLGVQRGTSEADYLEKQKTDAGWDYDLRFYDSAPMAIEDLMNGRIDAACMDSLPANDAASKKPVAIVGLASDEEDDFAVATRNEDAELRQLINEGYKLLMADPKWEELKDKYVRK